MSRHEREGVRSVLQPAASAVASTPRSGSSVIRKKCVYSGCKFVASGTNEKLATHSMGSHVSNCHGSQTQIWYGAKQITIKRDLATQEMRCPCGYSQVNSALVRRHAMKEHKASDMKTVLLSNRQPSQPGPSTSSTPSRPESVSSIETASSVRSVSPVQISDTPPTSRASRLSTLSKGVKASSRSAVPSATPQRKSLSMVEKHLFKPGTPRTTAAHPLSVSAPKKLGEEVRANAPPRKSVQTSSLFRRQSEISAPAFVASGSSRGVAPQKAIKTPVASSSAVVAAKILNIEKVPSIQKAFLGRKAQSNSVSVGSKRSGSPSLIEVAVPPKVRKVSQVSDASSSRKIPAVSPLLSDPAPSADEGVAGEGMSSWATELLSKPQTACATCRRPLNPLHIRYKNCDQCREKQRAYARRRKERGAGVAPRGASTSSGVRTSSPDGAMDVDEDEGVAGKEARSKKAAARCVWDDVPEFQTEDGLLAEARRAVLAWPTRPSAQFEFRGGYAVVVGSADVDAALTKQLRGKLVLQGVPMKKHSCSSRLSPGRQAPKNGAYHVYESLSTVYYCTCKDEEGAGAAGEENVCGGRVKIVVETTNEKGELGVFGQNVVVETLHA